MLQRTGHAAVRNPLKAEEILIFGGMGPTATCKNIRAFSDQLVVLDTRRYACPRTMILTVSIRICWVCWALSLISRSLCPIRNQHELPTLEQKSKQCILGNDLR